MSYKKEKIPIVIKLYIACKKLHKLRYQYKDIYKKVFIDKYK